MTIQLSHLIGRDVLDVSSATTIGRVDRAVVDPDRGAVCALHLAKVDDEADLLPWQDIKAIGPDAITVESASRLRTASGRSESRSAQHELDPIGSRLLSTTGIELGEVTELELDEETGSIGTITTGRVSHPGSSIVGLGTYALVVEAPEA